MEKIVLTEHEKTALASKFVEIQRRNPLMDPMDIFNRSQKQLIEPSRQRTYQLRTLGRVLDPYLTEAHRIVQHAVRQEERSEVEKITDDIAQKMLPMLIPVLTPILETAAREALSKFNLERVVEKISSKVFNQQAIDTLNRVHVHSEIKIDHRDKPCYLLMWSPLSLSLVSKYGSQAEFLKINETNQSDKNLLRSYASKSTRALCFLTTIDYHQQKALDTVSKICEVEYIDLEKNKRLGRSLDQHFGELLISDNLRAL